VHVLGQEIFRPTGLRLFQSAPSLFCDRIGWL
jgi:hypothetical protein